MTYTPPKRPPLDEAIWRYIDLAKFVSMLESKSLFFASWITLKTIDELEGLFLPDYLKKSLDEERKRLELEEMSSDEHKKYEDMLRTGMHSFLNWYFINCWHLSKHESQAMWKLYGSGNQNVALRTTTGRLQQAFLPEQPQLFGLVDYITHGQDEKEWQSPEKPLFHKDISLEHEKELRVVFCKRTPELLPGIHVSVDLSILVQSVVISPYADKWLKDVVQSLLIKYGLPEVPVNYSRLSTIPESLL